jgi:hypothetical protein
MGGLPPSLIKCVELALVAILSPANVGWLREVQIQIVVPTPQGHIGDAVALADLPLGQILLSPGTHTPVSCVCPNVRKIALECYAAIAPIFGGE